MILAQLESDTEIQMVRGIGVSAGGSTSWSILSGKW